MKQWFWLVKTEGVFIHPLNLKYVDRNVISNVNGRRTLKHFNAWKIKLPDAVT